MIKHCAEAIISCNGAQQDTTANLEDDSDWSNVTDVAKLWMSNKKKGVSIRIRYIYGSKALGETDIPVSASEVGPKDMISKRPRLSSSSSSSSSSIPSASAEEEPSSSSTEYW